MVLSSLGQNQQSTHLSSPRTGSKSTLRSVAHSLSNYFSISSGQERLTCSYRRLGSTLLSSDIFWGGQALSNRYKPTSPMVGGRCVVLTIRHHDALELLLSRMPDTQGTCLSSSQAVNRSRRFQELFLSSWSTWSITIAEQRMDTSSSPSTISMP